MAKQKTPLQSLNPGETDGPKLVTITARAAFKPRPPLLKNLTGQTMTETIRKARGGQ